MSRNIQLESLPSKPSMYAGIASTFLKKGKGNLPDISVQFSNAVITPDDLKKYNKVCGFDHQLIVPSTFIYAYTFPLQMHLLSQPEVPFPLAGLVHFANSIKQHRPLYIGESFNVTCKLGNLVAHDKGQAFEVVCYADVNGKRIWEDVSIYLFKGKEGIGNVLDWHQPELSDNCIKESWNLAKNLGLEYAQASGDFNPIHLHPLTAKLFGFQTHIIHGMWNVGKILSKLEPRIPNNYELTVLFKTPIYLPSTIIKKKKKTDDGFNFDIVDKKQEKPHVKGYIKKL